MIPGERKMKKISYLIIVLLMIFSIQSIAQTIPQTINYQGVLKDAAGVVVTNGDYNITFKLYNTELGGTELWTETKLINVVDGIINTQLGSATLLNLPFDAAYWLGITVSSGSELSPRIKLSSVPYSFMTMNVTDGSITSAKIANGSIVDADINDNAAISIFKILGDAGLEFRTWGTTFYGVPANSSTVIDMGSISLTAPTSGHVIVWLSGYATFFGDGKTMAVGINTDNTSIYDDASVYIGRQDGTGTLRFTESFNAMGVFVISGGVNYTFYALVQGNTTFGAVSANVAPQTMTAIFIPKRY
jgi:hypothetical protein